MAFEKKFIRVPKEVFALQWTPYARLPMVENIMGEVVNASSASFMGGYNPLDPYQSPQKPKMMIVSAKVKLGSEERTLEPYDYVVYDCETQKPIQVLTESTFINAYVKSEDLQLCESCAAKAKALYTTKTAQPQSLEEIVALLNSGKSITLSNGAVIRTVEELKSFAAKSGATINL